MKKIIELTLADLSLRRTMNLKFITQNSHPREEKFEAARGPFNLLFFTLFVIWLSKSESRSSNNQSAYYVERVDIIFILILHLNNSIQFKENFLHGKMSSSNSFVVDCEKISEEWITTKSILVWKNFYQFTSENWEWELSTRLERMKSPEKNKKTASEMKSFKAYLFDNVTSISCSVVI